MNLDAMCYVQHCIQAVHDIGFVKNWSKVNSLIGTNMKNPAHKLQLQAKMDEKKPFCSEVHCET